jgi:DNA-binding CsgD family transcriptional regulator
VLEGNLGEALSALGRLEEARHRLELAAAGWTAVGREPPTPADPGLAWLELAEGNADRAAARYEALARSEAPDVGLFELAAPVGAGHAWSKVALGELDQAQEIVDRHLALWRATDDRLAVVPLAVAGVAAGGEVGTRCHELLRELADEESAAAGVVLPFASAYALAEDDPVAASRAMLAASEGLGGRGHRWWSAFARFLAGSTAKDGATELLEARQDFREMGADAWRQRAEGELRARGRRIPSRADGRPARPGDLSARELEVLQELARGLTNREIGDELYISERTVARHVGKILSKLDVKNRTSAVQEARQRGLLGN